MQCTCKVPLRHVRATIVVVGKAKSITYSECVFVAFVAFGVHHAMRMRYIIICGLPSTTIFSHIIS